MPASEELRMRMDNPLVFIILVAIGVFGVGKLGQWTGGKLGWPGMSSFFGAK